MHCSIVELQILVDFACDIQHKETEKWLRMQEAKGSSLPPPLVRLKVGRFMLPNVGRKGRETLLLATKAAAAFLLVDIPWMVFFPLPGYTGLDQGIYI